MVLLDCFAFLFVWRVMEASTIIMDDHQLLLEFIKYKKSTKSLPDMIRGLINVIPKKRSPEINKQNHKLRKSERSPRCISIFHRLFTLRISSPKFWPSLFSQRDRGGRKISKTHARINPSWALETVGSAKRQILAGFWCPGTFLRGPSAEAVVPLSQSPADYLKLQPSTSRHH